jgi:single-stranded DNA-binding protein
MVNEVRISGKITDGYNDAPAIRVITKKDSDEVAGYAAQIEYQARRGRAFLSITCWDANSVLGQALPGDEITVRGTLDSDSWKTGDEWHRRTTILAESVAIPRLYLQAAGDAA